MSGAKRYAAPADGVRVIRRRKGTLAGGGDPVVSIYRRTGGPVADDTAELFARFWRHQERRGCQPSTARMYRNVLTLLAEWLYPRGLLDAGAEDLEQFLDARDLIPRTRYSYLSRFATFYRWAQLEELGTDPTLRIVRPRATRHMPRPIATDELSAAVAGAPPQMKAWLTLGAFQGLRCQEIAGLQVEDVLDHQDPPVLIVSKGKGNRERVVPLHERTLAALRVAGLPKVGYVFTRGEDTNQPLSPWQVSHKISRYLKSIGIDATAHQLRHWFGTQVYAQCQDLRVTQELLGHSSPTTTIVYVAYSAATARSAVEGLDL